MPREPKFGDHLKRGGVELRRYLDTRGISVPKFCHEHALDRFLVQRMLLGQRGRVGVDFALAIEKATEGAVPVAMWAEDAAPPGASPDESGAHAAVDADRAV